MVDELFDGDMSRQLGKAADVIVVIVSDYQVIDLLNAGVLDRCHNASSIPDGAVPAVPGIDEHRFPGGRYKKHGISAFHVDHINVQGVPALCNSERCGKNDSQQKQDCAHPSPLLSPL